MRQLMRLKLLTLLMLGAVGFAAAAPSRPNIIFILADDLGYGDLGLGDGGKKVNQGSLLTVIGSPDLYCQAA